MPDPSIKAATRAVHVDLFIENPPPASTRTLSPQLCRDCGEPVSCSKYSGAVAAKSRYHARLMVLHLIKLAVGVDDLAHMKKLQAARRKQRRQGPRSAHWVYTRHMPKRVEELLQ